MAKGRQQQQGTPSSTNRFDKGLVSDMQNYHLDEQSWISARNAINNSHVGDLGDLGNEPANGFCAAAPYTIIGTLHREKNIWSIYSTDDSNGHEIGIFDADKCEYTVKVNAPCLNFSTLRLITGWSRPTFDCSFRDYFADGLNPDRTIDLDAIPWVQDCEDDNGDEPGGCVTCVDTDVLDCDKIRLEAYIAPPCITIERGASGGSVLNGSYYAHVAYVINSQRVTDYFLMSNVLSLFEHNSVNASLEITIENLDLNFDEYELVLVQQIAEKMSVKKIGIYSTGQNKITIDIIDPTLPEIRPNDLIITNPIADRSKSIFSVGKYLFRTGITGKFDFNYQPLANQITAKWQVVEYPEDYYKNGGSHIGNMRDEVYPYFIRFRYNTGDFTNSYHIPGRGAINYLTPDGSGTLLESDDYVAINNNNIENLQGLTSKVFEMFNTALGSIVNIPLADGGIVTAEGIMGYHESSEFYDDKHPEIWNSNIPGRPELDLCGKPIRHHKMPENTLYSGTGSSSITNHYVNGQKKIRILAVAFDNIQPPVDNNGVPIPGILGYEILRGTRAGNKTVLYKGLINNMREYTIPETLNIDRQGLYPNYPFNSVAYADAFTSTDEVSYETLSGNSGTATEPNNYLNYFPNAAYSQKHFTFHSPDTMFYKPFLGQKELKIYGAMYGKAEAKYVKVDKHPKHVFVTDVSMFVGIIAGVGLAIAKALGKRNVTFKEPSYYSYDQLVGDSSTAPLNALGSPLVTGMKTIVGAADTLNFNLTSLLSAITGVNLSKEAMDLAESTTTNMNATTGTGITHYGIEYTTTDVDQTPPVLKALQAVYVFGTDVSEGADLTMNLIRNMSKNRQFALQYMAHCGYENFGSPYTTNRRRLINEAVYLSSHLQNYLTTHRINNILRNKTVAFDTTVDVENLVGALIDNTMENILASDLPNNDAFQGFTRQASSHYAAFKTRKRNQYGQLQSIRQLPASYCVIPLAETTSGTIFGGDTYIGRYQEKNTYYHFYQWLYDQPDRAEFNYHLYDTVQHTAFWMDTEPFDTMEFTASIDDAIFDAVDSGDASSFWTGLVTPSDKHCFDRMGNSNGIFTVKSAYMYLFHSSVRDFFVETELNIDHRDHDGTVATHHWSALQDLDQMFNSSIIKAGNYYSLDRGLSVPFLPFTKLSWGKMQDRNYDPTKAETCYTDYPKRLLYSLPQETALKADNWSVFLANNYKDFPSTVVSVKSVRGTGIMVLFENMAPGLFPGVDELQLTSGTSITVGDGGLFAREMQSLSNADSEYEYGSCQSKRGIVNTPAGVFYLCLDQGKAFHMTEGLKELTLKSNQFWFNQYLPYQLLLEFPDFDILDNPVAGIGCQVSYDNEWGLVYFCKKDYRLKPEQRGRVEYIGNGQFLVNKFAVIKTGDPRYFDNASWTISYDPAEDEEVAWHDWHPDLIMGSTNSFHTTKGKGIWEHNTRCDLYCNYYGVDYPFEIEFQFDNLPAVTTLKSLEYWLKVYKFADNCRDRFHVLDFNFDEAIIYNSEQVSGLLKLNLTPKNNVATLLQYPIVGLNDIQILYSKEEQKYRFNQFWDITKDRGEYSNTSELIWNTEPNGYIKNLNPVNLNYSKNEFQRKKFRHNNNKILLRRTVSGDKNMLLSLNTSKIQISSR